MTEKKAILHWRSVYSKKIHLISAYCMFDKAPAAVKSYLFS